MPFGFGNDTNTNNSSATENKAGKKWRATVGCIYKGKYVAAGTVVSAAEMKNPHFEEVKEEDT